MCKTIVVSAVLLNLLCSTSQVNSDERETPGWEMEGRLGIESEPAYPGSDVYTSEPDADLTATYRASSGNEYFIGIGEIGLRAPIGSASLFSATLEYEAGRDNANDPILQGFRSVDNTLEGQIGMFREIGRNWSVGAVFQPDLLQRGKGVVYFFGVAYVQLLLRNLGMRSSWDISWADAEHMDTEFGVITNESVASGLAVYRPAAGLKSITLAFDAAWPLTHAIDLTAGLALERYLAGAADSPLIEDAGSSLSYEADIGFTFKLY